MFPSPPPPPTKIGGRKLTNLYHLRIGIILNHFIDVQLFFSLSFWINLGWLSKFVLITWRQNSRPRKVQILPTKQLQSTRYIWTEKHTKPKLSEVCVNWNCISWYCLLSEITPIIEYRCLNQCKFNLPHSSFNYPPPPTPRLIKLVNFWEGRPPTVMSRYDNYWTNWPSSVDVRTHRGSRNCPPVFAEGCVIVTRA